MTTPLRPEPKSIWEDASSRKGVVISIFLVIILLLGVLFVFGKTPPEIPLQYSRPWGLEQLAPKSALWFIALGGVSVEIIHYIFASLALKEDRLSTHLIIWIEVFLVFFLILSVLTVYIRVGLQA